MDLQNSLEDNNTVESYFSKLCFKNQEEGIEHNPYDQEVREMLSIEMGDVEQLKKSLSESYTGVVGTLADTPLRSAKNIGIVVLALASRAAIRGGMAPEASFSLSDSYIRQIERCSNIESVYSLIRGAEFKYTTIVHELHSSFKKRNSIIDSCRNYIITHLHEKISVSDLAEYTGFTPSYISELFRSYTHTTVTECILQEKVKAAKNLLLYSPLSMADIALHLGFASQSHFGERFKKITGKTPGEFRALYGKLTKED